VEGRLLDFCQYLGSRSLWEGVFYTHKSSLTMADPKRGVNTMSVTKQSSAALRAVAKLSGKMVVLRLSGGRECWQHGFQSFPIT
jgi:hypothetical protein